MTVFPAAMAAATGPGTLEVISSFQIARLMTTIADDGLTYGKLNGVVPCGHDQSHTLGLPSDKSSVQQSDEVLFHILISHPAFEVINQSTESISDLVLQTAGGQRRLVLIPSSLRKFLPRPFP